MPVSMPLVFIPPTDPDIQTLHIYEGPTADGPFVEIDTVPAGLYPNYITRYVTENAQSLSDWFAIAWSTPEGVQSPLSDAIQGGFTSVVGDIVERVLLRSPDLDENIVLQETLATLQFILKVDDPYTIEPTSITQLQANELATLALVASLYVTVVQRDSTAIDYTAGLISERNTSNTQSLLENLERLERRALKRLGIGGSLIAAICDHPYLFSISGEKVSFDSSRLLQTRATLTDRFVVRDSVTGDLISYGR